MDQVRILIRCSIKRRVMSAVGRRHSIKAVIIMSKKNWAEYGNNVAVVQWMGLLWSVLGGQGRVIAILLPTLNVLGCAESIHAKTVGMMQMVF